MFKTLMLFLKSLAVWNFLIWVYSGMCWIILQTTIAPGFFTVVSLVYCAAIIFDLIKFLGLLYPVHPKILDHVNHND